MAQGKQLPFSPSRTWDISLLTICRQLSCLSFAVGGNKEDDHKLALVVDMRSRSFFSEIQAVLDELENQDDLDFKILFLDAADKELVARYKETRRSHPLAADGRILDGIKLERELLAPLKNMSQNVVDTTELTPRELRKTIAEHFRTKNKPSLSVSKSCLSALNMESQLMRT